MLTLPEAILQINSLAKHMTWKDARERLHHELRMQTIKLCGENPKCENYEFERLRTLAAVKKYLDMVKIGKDEKQSRGK